MQRPLISFLVIFVLGYPNFSNASLKDSFLGPNELHPVHQLNHLGNYTKGILISLGTDRALMTTALVEKVTAVVQIDMDPNVVRYNRINLELLKFAEDCDEYRFLRISATYKDWLQRVNGMESILSLRKEYNWWRKAMMLGQFKMFHERTPKADRFSLRPYEGANYLYNENLFQRLRQLALENKIQIRQVNLKNRNAIKNLVLSIDEGQNISLFDMSNAWWDKYAGAQAAKAIADILAIHHPGSRILFTYKRTWGFWPFEYASIATNDTDFLTKMDAYNLPLSIDFDDCSALLRPIGQ